MPLHAITLIDATLSLDRQWLDATSSDRLVAELRGGIAWENHRIRLFGREHASPRLSCWIGDPEASYRYSGTRFEPQPWPAVLLPIRARLHAELGIDFNSVLANRYRDGHDAMGWHSDNEAELGAEPAIASLSLGATRRFVLKHRVRPELKLTLELPHGSLLVMRGDTQRCYRHALPRTMRPVGERINLTFRRILPA